jgi:hypothetical protein
MEMEWSPQVQDRRRPAPPPAPARRRPGGGGGHGPGDSRNSPVRSWEPAGLPAPGPDPRVEMGFVSAESGCSWSSRVDASKVAQQRSGTTPENRV